MSRSRRKRADRAPATGATRPAAADAPERDTVRASVRGPRVSLFALLRTRPALGSALAAFLIYVPGLAGGFLRDDHFLIERHPFLRSPEWLGRLLLGDFWAPVSGATGMWRPLVVLSYWIDGRLGGWSPLWFHVVNAVAHAGASAAVARLVAATGGRPAAAWIAGLTFALMPAHVECVAWISGRTDVFCALFGVGALWLDMRARAAGRAWPGVLPVASLALALLSKEAGVTLIGVFAVMEWTRAQGRPGWLARGALWLAPYVLVTALYLVGHAVFAPDPGAISAPEVHDRAALRGAAWALFPGYLAFLWPWFPHSPDRAAPTFLATAGLETTIGAALAALVLALLAWRLWRRSQWTTPLALAIFPLVPPLLLASTRGFGLYGERHIYVSSAGFAWGLGLVLSGLAAHWRRSPARHIVTGLAAVFLAGSALETLRALPAYRDDASMYLTMTQREPENPIGFTGLAAALTERGQLEEALVLLGRAERIDPSMPSVAVGRARVASRREDWGAVLGESERALALDPELLSARLLRAVALTRMKRLEEAGQSLEALRREYPGHPEVATVWGQYLIATGRAAEALPVLEAAVAMLPREPSLWDAIGVAQFRLGRREQARDAFRRTVAISPGYLEGWMRLAGACHAMADAGGRDQALAQAALLPGGPERVAAFPRAIGAVAP